MTEGDVLFTESHETAERRVDRCDIDSFLQNQVTWLSALAFHKETKRSSGFLGQTDVGC